ncbi:MAG: hypothetical protein ACFB9M_17680 [Myxococcota bacterium]
MKWLRTAAAVLVVMGGPGSALGYGQSRVMLLVDQGLNNLSAQDRTRLHDALMLFVNTRRAEDSVGLVWVGAEASLAIPLGKAHEASARRQFRRTLELSTNAESADRILSGIQLALDALGPRSPNTHDRLVLLLAEAKLHPDETRRTLGGVADVVSGARARGVPLHVVTLRGGPDEVRFRGWAAQTGGDYHRIEDLRTLHVPLFHTAVVHESVDVLPTDGGTLMVDEDVQELALVLSRFGGDATVLHLPDETDVTSHHQPPGIAWNAATDFDLVQVREPMHGPWRIQQSRLDQAVVAVRDAALDLELRLHPDVPILGTEVRVGGRLVANGRTVRSYARLKQLEMAFILPTGQRLPLRPAANGWFYGSWRPSSVGPSKGTLLARSPHLRRSESARMVVDRQCFAAETHWQSRKIRVEVTRERACSELTGTTVEAALQFGEDLEWIDLERDDVGRFTGELAFQTRPAFLHLRARTYIGGRHRLFPLPPVPAPQSDVVPSSWGLFTRMALANTPLLLAFVPLMYRRRLRGLEAEG